MYVVPPSSESVGSGFKWWTWRRKPSGAGFLPCCSYEGQSEPGWPPPLLTSGLEPFYGPYKWWDSSLIYFSQKLDLFKEKAFSVKIQHEN